MKNIRSIFFITIGCAALADRTAAQDRIIKQNGAEIEARVREVTPKMILYKKYDNPEGPLYSIPRKDVNRIEYENGTEEGITPVRGDRGSVTDEGTSRWTRTNPTGADGRPVYGKNMISLIPIMIAADEVVRGDGFMQVGLCYERTLDKYGRFTVELPFYFSLSNNGTHSSGYYYSYNYRIKSAGPVWCFAPGIKISPAGNFRTFSYGVGPSLILVANDQTREETYYDPVTGTYTSSLEKSGGHIMFGLMMNNSLNFNPTPQFYAALETGLGVSYLQQFGGKSEGTSAIFRLGMKLGFRF